MVEWWASKNDEAESDLALQRDESNSPESMKRRVYYWDVKHTYSYNCSKQSYWFVFESIQVEEQFAEAPPVDGTARPEKCSEYLKGAGMHCAAVMTGLKPRTRYMYRVSSTAGSLQPSSVTGSFMSSSDPDKIKVNYVKN